MGIGKKTFLIAIVISLVAFVTGFYIVQENTPISTKTGSLLNKFSSHKYGGTEGENRLSVLTERRIVSPTNSNFQDSVIYYEKGTGRIYEVNLLTGKENPVSVNVQNNFIQAIWSPDKKGAVGIFSDKGIVDFRYYNFETGDLLRLGNNIKSIAFSPDSKELVYFQKTINGGQVHTLNLNSGHKSIIFKTRLDDGRIKWPRHDIITLTLQTKDNNYNVYQLTREGLLTKLINSLIDPNEKWSSDGSMILFNKVVLDNTTLFYKNLEGGGEVNLGLSTSASKCSWGNDNETVFCSSKEGSVKESFFEVNINNLEIKQIYIPIQTVSTDDVFISKNNDFLIFRGRLDDKLYSLDLNY